MKSDHDELPPAEIADRMDRVIRRFLKMPPQPHGKNPESPPPRKKRSAKDRKAKSRS
jgi:hypothetical protein